MMRYAIARGAAAMLAMMMAPAAQAHHSMAMFDSTKEISLQGTVREFQWTNPHAYIQLVAQGADGKPVEWSMEMGSPMYLYARGWRPGSLKPGSKVTIRGYPLRDGHHGGVVLDVTDADGHKIGANQ